MTSYCVAVISYIFAVNYCVEGVVVMLENLKDSFIDGKRQFDDSH